MGGEFDMKKIIKGKLAMLLALILVFLSCVPSLAASSYSTKWYKTADGQWQAKKYGILLKSTWILDDECDVQGGIWYLVDENGNLVTDKLVKDGNGRYYTFNDQHDGHYGTLITKDGKYYGVDLKFSQIQDASYGSIINTEGITALKKAYGVREFPNLTNASSVRLSTGTSSVRSSRKKSTPTPSPITYDKKTKYYVDYDVNGVSDVQDMPTAEWVGYGEYATKPVPATPSVVTTGTATPSQICTGWYTSTSATPDTKWDFTKDRVFNNMTLYAGWVESECTVTFVDDKNSTSDSKTVPYGSKIKKIASPSTAGYTFRGWYKDNEPGLWDFDNDIVKESMQLNAFWATESEAYYTVSFVTAHGETPRSQLIEDGSQVERPVDPVDTEYTFINWYSDPDYVDLWDFDNYNVDSDTAIYAKWIKKQEETKSEKITQNSSKSTVEFKAEEVVKKASMPMTAAKSLIPTVVDGEAVKSSESIYTELSLTLKVDTVTEDSVVYDISLLCTSNVTSGGAITRTETTQIEDANDLVTIELQIEKGLTDVTVKHSGIVMEELTSASAIPADKVVGGVYYNPSTGVATIKTQSFSPFEFIYSTGIINDLYSVTFNCNGHGENTRPAKITNVVQYATVSEPTAPEADGWTFGGWFKEKECKNKWDFDTDTVDGNIILYAKWETSGFELLITKSGESDLYLSLSEFRDIVNASGSHEGEIPNTYEGYKVTLLKDIDLNGKEWIPIGTGYEYYSYNYSTWTDTPISEYYNYFKGEFDGNGKTISNLSLQDPLWLGEATKDNDNYEDYYLGLFGITYGATIKNLTLKDCSMTTNGYGPYGILASETIGTTVSNCHMVNCDVSGAGMSGLMIDHLYNNSVVENCTTDLQSSVNATSGSYNSGIVAYAYKSTINSCTNNAKINGTKCCTGIVGNCNQSNVNDCINNGDISSTGASDNDSFVGGIAGTLSSANIKGCINTGTVTTVGSNSPASGIAGQNSSGNVSYVKQCANTGNITGKYASGIIGTLYGATTPEYCFNSGTITGTSYADGICGGPVYGNHKGDAKCSLNSGTLYAPNIQFVAGNTFEKCYYYDDSVLKKADGSNGVIQQALSDLNYGLSSPYWCTDAGVIKPICLVD